MNTSTLTGILLKAAHVLKLDDKLELLKNRSQLTNERILTGLQKVGVASQDEVQALQEKLARLEAELTELRAAKVKKPAAKPASPDVTESA